MTDYYSDFGTIAPGNSVTVVMPVKEGMQTGTFYPTIYDDFNRGMRDLKQPLANTIGPYSPYPIGNYDADNVAGFAISFVKNINDQITHVLTYKNPSGELITEYYPISVANHIESSLKITLE